MKRNVLLVLGFILMTLSLYRVFVYVHAKNAIDTMGLVGKTFFLMVPVGWLALLAFFVIFICSILYLTKRQSRWDIIARSSAEIGIVCTSLAMIVGTIWGSVSWGNIWAVWRGGEPRLMATLVLWFIYLAYFLVRSFASEESRGARFAAVIGIVGFVDVPIVGMATSLWRGQHPPPMIFTGDVASDLLLSLMISIAAFTVLFFILLVLRVSMANNEVDIKQLKERDS